MRRSDGGIGCGACGFASQAKAREAPGPRPGGTKTALRGARWTGTGQIAASSQEARIRGLKSPRWSAGRREALARASSPQGDIQDVAPPGAPSPSAYAEREI